VRRSFKGWAGFGAVQVEEADTPEQAQAFLSGLKTLHSAHWQARGDTGAFASSFANRFHDDLVQTGLTRGEVQLLRVKAGQQTVGYLYNFVHRGKVMNYQAGIDYSLPPAGGSPGLAVHVLAVEFNAARGHAVYDFMAGDQHYKRALSTDITTQHWIVVRRKLWKFRVEDCLRKLRNRVRRQTSKDASP
jgi:CelD/BcsL family acetyltransferase involved in cellulose biosynthesis